MRRIVVAAFLTITAIASGFISPLKATAAPSSAAVDCNRPGSEPIAWVDLPSAYAFQALPSHDGCSIFVSLATGDGEASDSDPAAKIAILARNAGRISLRRVVHVGGNPNGMALTHDGLLRDDFPKNLLRCDPFPPFASSLVCPKQKEICDVRRGRYFDKSAEGQTREAGCAFPKIIELASLDSIVGSAVLSETR